ncbi:F-box domain protein [Mycena venus]|uniref:F-box domain protein n=1 Tax=Mycena venus TaxID=2733690 RepID=A0A8H6YTZ8_9AGAR|nr:F-box domain protein [Mycena venus]
MSTAKDTVIHTPELLEITLSYLPMRDLLVTAPLVCKTWQALTVTPALQRALFLLPEPPNALGRIHNPLLAEVFRPFFAPEAPSRWSWPDAKKITKKSTPWAKAPEAFRRPEASWRRMLVTQPPVQKMTVIETCHSRGGDSERRAMLKDLSLCMGTLYDLVLSLIDRVVCSFCIRWHQEAGSDTGITLAVIWTQQCSMGTLRVVKSRFYSEAGNYEGIEFGEWGEPRHRSPIPESALEDFEEDDLSVEEEDEEEEEEEEEDEEEED